MENEKINRQLIAQGVTVRFGGLVALNDINLRLDMGEIVGLIGPNGAGKTTLVNCLSGFQKPTSGRVLVDGRSTQSWSPPDFRSNKVARTFQSGRLFADLTVCENIEVPLVSLGMSRRQARVEALTLLDRLNLTAVAERDAATLPYTDERRVGIARALAMNPSFVLLDEPAAGMSDSECDELMEVIQALPRDFGCGVLLIEHNMTVVMNVSDRIHVLDVGQTLAEGKAEDIRSNPAVIDAYLGSEL